MHASLTRYILEGSSDSMEERSEELRKKMTTIRRCDVNDQHPLGEHYEGSYAMVAYYTFEWTII